MARVTIRRTKAEDYGSIRTLFKICGLNTAFFTKERFVRMIRRNREYCFVAEAEKRIVGSAFGAHDGGFTGHVSKVAVSSKYRRQGIAGRLVNKILDRFKDADIPLAFCHIEKVNSGSIEFFRSLGFEVRRTHYLVDKGYKRI